MMTHRFRSWLLLVLLPCLLLFPFVRGKPAPYVLSQEQMDTFHRDGVLVIRGLLQGNDLKGAIRTTRRIQRFQGLGQRIMYKLFPNYKLIEFQTWKKHKVLERIAFDSAAPTICARLMGLDNDNDDDNHASQNHPNKNSHHRSLRLLKDAVFGYRAGDEGCGWHVDDKGFWPCEDRNIGRRDAGINVWITLSPVTAAEGGGLAVAPGTHKMSFTKKARDAIAEKGALTTCHLQVLQPECHAKMESLKKVYDLQPGDAIFHDRYVFHRADHFVDSNKKRGGVKQRISLRYVPDDSTFQGLGSEVAANVKNLSTGDAIRKGAEYYPQTWPDSLPEERNKKGLKQEKVFTLKTASKIIWKRAMSKRKD